ncbi:MAG: hypothetical protein UT82_C0009G0043 [Parcubacteria group bacterium GW2011_GWB1_40_14]|nr:MAG: hypothetical protein UT82_C0009G0043 [Parcubacteria group bacterium GW2011_GWB1_40_14]
MNPENPEHRQEVTLEELQAFINDPALELPEMRRDISKIENTQWLLRNLGIQNKSVPSSIYEALNKISE